MLRFFGWLMTFIIFGALTAATGLFLVLYYYGSGLPDYGQLKDYEPPVVSRLYANDGRLFAEYATEKRVFVPIEAIPRRVIDTFLAAEDKNFYEHPGLDFLGIARAAIVNFKNIGSGRRPMGASTITQQVAKNLLMSNVASKASYERKLQEAILAFRIEKALSKDRILELYLNEIYLGGRAYGVAAAALNYFNKSLDELTISEAAFLAALPKAPSRYHPKRNYKLAKSRRDWVITRMYEEGIITLPEAIEAKKEDFHLRNREKTEVVQADYFAEDVRRYLMREYGDQVLYGGGLAIRTTLDPQMQSYADKALHNGLVSYDRRHGYRGPITNVKLENSAKPANWLPALEATSPPAGINDWRMAIVTKVTANEAHIGLHGEQTGTLPLSELKWARKDLKNAKRGPVIKKTSDVLKVGDIVLVDKTGTKGVYSLQQIPAVSGSIVAMDAYTGRVLAMAGGWSYDLSQYNCATQAKRQPGSAIKPFIYLTAMEVGFTPATIVSDSPISISLGEGLGEYSPKNVTERYYGPVPMRIGLQKSLNMLTVRLAHEYIGMRPIKKTIEQFGITDNLPLQLAMVLGAGETTNLKLTTAFAMLANGGRIVKPALIDRIQDRNGKTIFRSDQRDCINCQDYGWHGQSAPTIENPNPYLVDPRSAFQVTSMMEGAVRMGSARRSQAINKIVAVKTGTTNDERDAWTLGYAPNGLVVGVFVGFANPQHMGEWEGGAKVAQPLFIEFMKDALADTPSIPFKTPPGLQLARVNEMTGQPPEPGDTDIIWEIFKTDVPAREIPMRATFGDSHMVENQYNQRYGTVTDEIIYDDSPAPPQHSVTGTGGLY